MGTPPAGPDKAALARLFSRTSGSHDTAGTPLFARFGELLVERAGLRPGDRVLDVAAGAGATLIPAARRVGGRGRVTGVDLAPGMVRRLIEAMAAQGIGNAEALVADAEHLPFDAESFDAVLCGFALFFFPDTARALAEVRRVLRGGGVLAISTFSKAGSASIDSIWERISAHIAGPPPADEARRFDEPGSLVEALERAGFVGIDVEGSPLEVRFADFEAWWSWIWSMEFREYLELMDGEVLERFRASTADHFAGQPGAPEIRLRMDALLARARSP